MSLAPRPTYGPEDANSPPPTPSLWKRIGHSPATLAIVIVNVIVFVVGAVSARNQGRDALAAFGANYGPLVFEEGQWWRLATYMFLHVNLVHLAVNTYFGFGWSTRVEQWFGTPRFLIAYFATGIIAGLTSALANDVPSVGASGALFGMIGVTLGVLYSSLGSLSAFFKDPAVRNTLINLAVLLVLGMTVLPLDNWAHGGGLVAGVGVGLIFVEQVKRKARRDRASTHL